MNVNFNPSVKTNTNFQAVSQKYLKTAKKYSGFGSTIIIESSGKFFAHSKGAQTSQIEKKTAHSVCSVFAFLTAKKASFFGAYDE